MDDINVSLTRTEHVTTDAGEVPPLHASWMECEEYYQIDSGRFEGRLREAVLGSTLVLEETQNRAVHKIGTVRSDRCNFGFARSFGGTGRCQDHALAATSFSYVPAGEIDILIPRSSIVVISVNQEKFMTAIATAGHWLEGNERQPHSWDMPGHNPLMSVIDILLGQDEPSGRDPGLLDAEYLDAVLTECLLDTLAHPERKAVEVTMGRSRAYRTVRAACEFADATLDKPLTMLDLCRALGVSRRNLQYAFADILGMPPQTYLRRVRLNRVRRDLTNAHSERACVTRVAMHWGFCHLGHFSQDYRRLFGESPSETLRRTLA